MPLRPRERYRQTGPDPHDTEQLLALVLGTGVRGHSTRTMARRLLQEFGGVRGIASAPPGALAVVEGVGEARAVRVHAACALADRVVRREVEVLRVRDAASAWRALRPGLDGLEHEELHAAYVDRRGRLLHVRALTRGSPQFTIVDPAQVLRPAVQLGAAGVVLAHNHPSGDPTPSAQDVATTSRVQQAAEVLNIRLLDHLVLGGGRFVSLAEQGHLVG
jgi:DNA repair protein RadC